MSSALSLLLTWQNIHNTSRDFERLIAHLLETTGFDVELTAASRDGGYDIVAFSSDSIGIKTKYIVECKRYHPDNPVGVQLVRSLYGIKDLNKAQHAVLATTSYFTRDAIAFKEKPSVLGLHYKDVNDIMALLNDLWVEDFSESYLGKTARGPRGPNFPPRAPNLSLCPIGFAERIG